MKLEKIRLIRLRYKLRRGKRAQSARLNPSALLFDQLMVLSIADGLRVVSMSNKTQEKVLY
jgi:hypothetical protein